MQRFEVATACATWMGQMMRRAPPLALWGANGMGSSLGRGRDLRKKTAGQITGEAFPCGHLLPEEQPDVVLAQLRSFFGVEGKRSTELPG